MNQAIQLACKLGRLEIVQCLLTDKRVNPFDFYNQSLQNASKNGFLEIVNLLLKMDEDGGGIINFFHSALYGACKNGHSEVVKALLDDKRTEIWLNRSNRCLKRAVKQGHSEVVKLLLQKIYVSIDIKEPLYIAVKKGNLEITKLILEHKRRSLHYYGTLILEIEEKKVNENMMKLLLSYQEAVRVFFK